MMVTVVRTTPGDVDQYGNPTESTVTRHEIDAAVAPRTTSDVPGPGRSGVVIGLELFAADPCVDLLHTDQIEYLGDLWDIDGDIGVWVSPFGAGADGVSCALKRGQG